MKEIIIKSKKQENGLWGMPLKCTGIDKLPTQNKELLHSAIICAMNNTFSDLYSRYSFFIYNSTVNGFNVQLNDAEYPHKFYIIKYNCFELEDNTLYEFDTEKEHTVYLRKQKIKNIENEKYR